MNLPEPARQRRLATKLSKKSQAPLLRPKGRSQKGAEGTLGSFAFPQELDVFSQLKGFKPEAGPWRALLRYYLKRLGCPQASLSLGFCSAQESRRLNRRWRQKDKEGDVLSFPLQEKAGPSFRGMLGDLLINLPYVRRHPGRFGSSLHEELAFLTLHGLLHLCGQHHDSPAEEARMWRLTRKHFPPPPRLLNALRVSLNNAH